MIQAERVAIWCGGQGHRANAGNPGSRDVTEIT